MIGFRIDGLTIKGGAVIRQFGHVVPLGVGKLCIAFRTSAQRRASEKVYEKYFEKMLTWL